MDTRLNKALLFIHRNLTDKIIVGEVAMEACTSYRNLLRLFKKHFNITPCRYIEQIKIQRSLQLIMDDRKSIQDISAEMGYKNYETFSKAFLKVYHISPGDLKEILKSVILPCKNECQVMNLEVQSANRQNLPDYLIHLKNRISPESGNKGYKAFIVSRKPLSFVSSANKVRNKFYVAGM